MLAATSCTKGTGVNTTASFGGGDRPKIGSLLGNWKVAGIKVLSDTGDPHNVREGMTFRLANNRVVILAGLFLGHGAAIKRSVETIFGGTFERKETVNAEGFKIELIIDYSAAFFLPPRLVYDRFFCQGKLGKNSFTASYLFQSFEPRNFVAFENDRDHLQIVCVPGPPIEDVSGTWVIDELEVLRDSGPPSNIKLNDKLVLQDRQAFFAFDTPFTVDKFVRANPDFFVLDRFSFAHDGVAEGFLWAVGRPNTLAAGTGIVTLFDFTQTGTDLRGWFLRLRITANGQNQDELLVNMKRASHPSSLQDTGARILPRLINQHRKAWRLLRTPAEIEELRERLDKEPK